MKIPDNRSMFGSVPDDFGTFLEGAVQKEAFQVKKKAVSTLVLAAALLVLLAATALAVASHIGLIDLLGHANSQDREAISGMVAADLPQQGTDMEAVTVTVREAIYDGETVHLLVAVMPREEGTALGPWETMPEASDQRPETVKKPFAVDCNLSILTPEGEDVPIGGDLTSTFSQEAEGLLYVFSGRLAAEAFGTALQVQVWCNVWDAEGTYMEQGFVTLQLRQGSGTAAVQTFEMDVAVGSLTMRQIELRHTPLEMYVDILYKQPEISHAMQMDLVDIDGRALRMAETEWGFSPEHMLNRFSGRFETTPDYPGRLIIGIAEEEAMLVLDTSTGETSVHPATLHMGPTGNMLDARYDIRWDISR